MDPIFKAHNGKPFLIWDSPKFIGGDCKWLKVGDVVEAIGKKVKGNNYDAFKEPVTYSGTVKHAGTNWLCFKVSKEDSPTRTANAYVLYEYSEDLDELYQPVLGSSSNKIYKAQFKKLR